MFPSVQRQEILIFKFNAQRSLLALMKIQNWNTTHTTLNLAVISPGQCTVPPLGVPADAPPVIEWPAPPKATSVPDWPVPPNLFLRPIWWSGCLLLQRHSAITVGLQPDLLKVCTSLCGLWLDLPEGFHLCLWPPASCQTSWRPLPSSDLGRGKSGTFLHLFKSSSQLLVCRIKSPFGCYLGSYFLLTAKPVHLPLIT